MHIVARRRATVAPLPGRQFVGWIRKCQEPPDKLDVLVREWASNRAKTMCILDSQICTEALMRGHSMGGVTDEADHIGDEC